MRHPSPFHEKPTKKGGHKKDISSSYNHLKRYKGQSYTGAAIGRGHKWYYDQGEWKEKKISPDKWEFAYAVTKRRAGHAPEGSGVPVGTEYHWIILAHQIVRKLNANDYSTAMTGVKSKLGHKRADHAQWNISDRAQRRRLLTILQELVNEIKAEHDINLDPTTETKSRRSPIRVHE